MDWLLHHLDISPFSWASILICVFCGTIIGLERQLKGKPVGIRTSILIILGTYIFLTTAFVYKSDAMDPSRVIGQVITGIGFLGAGVMLAKDGAVVGVTSAAVIWVLAAIGTAIATVNDFTAVKLSVLTVAILFGIETLEDNFKSLGRGVHRRIVEHKNRPGANKQHD